MNSLTVKPRSLSYAGKITSLSSKMGSLFFPLDPKLISLKLLLLDILIRFCFSVNSATLGISPTVCLRWPLAISGLFSIIEDLRLPRNDLFHAGKVVLDVLSAWTNLLALLSFGDLSS